MSGADPIEGREGFPQLHEGNGVRVVILEDAGRFARELDVASLSSNLSRLDSLNVSVKLFAHHLQIVARLNGQPEFGRGAEIAG